jgi:chloride channel 3/4/5
MAFLVVRSEQWLFDAKEGYCRDSWWNTKRLCCPADDEDANLFPYSLMVGATCESWITWGEVFGPGPHKEGWFGFERNAVEYIAYAVVAVSTTTHPSLSCLTARLSSSWL